MWFQIFFKRPFFICYLLIFANKFGKTIYNATNEWLVLMLNVLRWHVFSEFESKEIPFAFIFLIWIFFSLNFLHVYGNNALNLLQLTWPLFKLRKTILMLRWSFSEVLMASINIIWAIRNGIFFIKLWSFSTRFLILQTYDYAIFELTLGFHVAMATTKKKTCHMENHTPANTMNVAVNFSLNAKIYPGLMIIERIKKFLSWHISNP